MIGPNIESGPRKKSGSILPPAATIAVPPRLTVFLQCLRVHQAVVVRVRLDLRGRARFNVPALMIQPFASLRAVVPAPLVPVPGQPVRSSGPNFLPIHRRLAKLGIAAYRSRPPCSGAEEQVAVEYAPWADGRDPQASAGYSFMYLLPCLLTAIHTIFVSWP